MNRLKVWVVGRGIPSPHNKMLGSFELEQAQALEKAGLDVVYIGISVRSAQNLRNVGFSTNDDFSIPAYSFNFPIGRVFSQTITDKIFNTAFSVISKKIVKEHGMPDIIHIHYPAQRPYDCLRRMQKQGVKIVVTEHWSKVQNMAIGEKPKENLTDFVNNSNAFICVSSCLARSVKDISGTPREISVVPNLVNSVFNNRFSRKNECFNFVISGSLFEFKQVDKVVRAFMDVFDKNEKVSITIAGGGEQYNTLKDIIENEDRGDQIHLLGPVSREKMANIMASSDALVTYSRMETFCVPVIEAWMCGIPVIASHDIPAIIDNPDERLGIVVDCNNINTLKNALRQMQINSMKYDADFIRLYAINHFSESAISQRLIGIYNRTFETE